LGLNVAPHNYRRVQQVAADAGFYRVQCKAARLEGDAVKFSTKSKGKRYENEVDYFGIYEPTSGNVYMVPIGMVGPKQSVALSLNKDRGDRYAERYRLR
jgi:hypothetical protein